MSKCRHAPGSRRTVVAWAQLSAVTLAIGFVGCSSDGAGMPGEEDLRKVQAELTLSQRMARYAQIRDAAYTRGIDHTAYLLAGIAYAETGLAHCWSEATWACQGPDSADCGGGPVIAGASDGPCSAQQGGLGMFQFDAGTFTDTLNKYGADVLTVAGNTSHAIDYAVNMVRISAYTTNAETSAKALQWIINFDIHNATLRDQWIKTVTHYYNGCAPSYSCWSQRYAHYNNSLQTVIDETGLPFWVINPCECQAGQVQNDACGNCGTRSRSCNSNCKWNAWSACEGQGECSPGAVDQQACCDCGTRARTCSKTCSWGSFSACEGPDPAGGQQDCSTGEPGPCASGTIRCVSGCRKCQRTYEPQPERCDDIDNDCSGETDDGEPDTLGNPPPKMAARLVDVALPQTMTPGERASAWAVFRNEGQLTWPRGSLWLQATSTWNGKASPMHDADTWPSYDVAALLDQVVAPGEEAYFPFTVSARDDAQSAVADTFHLVGSDGTMLKCPSVSFAANVRMRTDESQSAVAETMDGSDGGCSVAPSRTSRSHAPWFGLVLGLLGLWRIRARRD